MTHQSTHINTVLLDADGVIQISGPNFISDVAALCPDQSRSDAFLEDVFLAEKPCLTGAADFPTALERVFVNWQVDTPVSQALELWQQIDPVPAILGHVSELRARGIRVCLASNQQAHRANIMANVLDYTALFDDMFFSYQLGVAKPSPEYFRKILKRLEIDGRDALFIDDHARNVAAAHEAGILGEIFHVRSGIDHFTSILDQHGLS